MSLFMVRCRVTHAQEAGTKILQRSCIRRKFHEVASICDARNLCTFVVHVSGTRFVSVCQPHPHKPPLLCESEMNNIRLYVRGETTLLCIESQSL